MKLGEQGKYETYTEINPNLLVPIERKRIALGVTGYDIWNCYEVSALMETGYPLVGTLKITYPSISNLHVESKSLKLYLNSFNLVECPYKATRQDGTIFNIGQQRDFAYEQQETWKYICNRIKEDLEEALKINVTVESFMEGVKTKPYVKGEWHNLYSNYTNWHDFEKGITSPNIPDFSEYSGSFTGTLKNGQLRYRTEQFKTNILRSNCPVTNQPDWADLYVSMRTPRVFDKTEFAKYIISLRQENHFHEETVELIYKEIWKQAEPLELFVAGFYTRRGGIDINPVRGSSIDFIEEHLNLEFGIPYEKLWRQ